MKKLLLTTLCLSGLLLPLVGCSSQTDAEKPVTTTAPIDNNSEAAKSAQGAPPPDSGMPPPGGGGMGLKGKR